MTMMHFKYPFRAFVTLILCIVVLTLSTFPTSAQLIEPDSIQAAYGAIQRSNTERTRTQTQTWTRLEEDRVMPMHQRFLLEQRRRRDHNKFTSTDAHTGADATRRLNHNTPHKGKYYEHPTTNKRTLDVLESSWWVRLKEGERGPDTRRAHSATIFEVMKGIEGTKESDQGQDQDLNAGSSAGQGPVKVPAVEEVVPDPEIGPGPLPSGGNGGGPDDADATFVETSDPDQEATTPSEDAEQTSPAQDNVDTESNFESPDSSGINSQSRANSDNSTLVTTESSSSDIPAEDSPVEDTTSSAPAPDDPQPGKRYLYEEIETEYMVVTGGFTDKDWETFPVWAYDMTDATVNDGGRWYELTPPSTATAPDNNADVCSTNKTDVGIEFATPCAPTSRVGHISVMRDDTLYVFGGFGYDDHDGVFLMEAQPYMYSMRLSEDKFAKRDTENYNNIPTTQISQDTLSWKRWLPKIADPMNDPFVKASDLNRGEVRGGYWAKGDKLVIFGGLHVREYETNTGRMQQADTPLSDVWAYDFKTDTWEMMDSHCPGSQCALDHPGERTSHAATIVGDELVIYGGLRKVDTYLWDGSTLWSQLDDIWIFDLNTLQWRQRFMAESMGRAYHAVIGWEMPDKGVILATMGGFKTMRDPVDNQQISSVYDDTMVSLPQENSEPSRWYLAMSNSLQSVTDTISTRLEHTAVLSRVHGNMIVWGGRFRETTDVVGVWSLNIAGQKSTVRYEVPSDDPDMTDPGMAYVLLVTVMMTSMMFTYMCGVVHRRMEDDSGINIDTLNGDQAGTTSVFGRNGLSQDIIETLPLKKYQIESGENSGSPCSNERCERAINNPSDSTNFDFGLEDDDDCCPICLVEYEVGDDIRCLPCNHEFHKSCVDPWLSNNASCPACRHSLSDLVSLTTSADFAAQIRATISARMRPSASASEPGESQPSSEPLSRQTSSPTAAPDQAIAPGIRSLNTLRYFFNNLRRRNELNSGGSRESDDGDIEVADLELSYSSSLELSDGNSSNDSSFDSEDTPNDGQPRRSRIADAARRRLVRGGREEMRGQRRRRRGNRRRQGSALNAPLQPSDASIV